MVKLLAACLVPVLLPACAAVPEWFPAALFAPATNSPHGPLGQYSFDWQLSGDREVAPLQIFDDGRRTWLQFAPQQPVPAIFESSANGTRPLSYTREGPYIVLPGIWPELMFRGGNLQSLANRGKPKDALATSPATAVPVTDIAVPDVAMALPVEVPPESLYDVSPHDQTLRATLARWAVKAGWTFQPEHWMPDVDIPIVGSASFAMPFKQAVQELVASTELADRPLQPCFYSNRVLRVVPFAQSCDRTAGPSSVS
ncbi:TcpQ domain-containing protein [Pusillimonas sp. MFBS29]|uniref:TcpQ domain-containing protein n=1 Tax=Pusillimonas sp. MFBS29 TaxID=2886690 RepID=UPI001D129ABF|nr:TcpQ domain-containing protein [Pusillimonas sp. MFBS29]MCC2595315.1 TcpQ domain-containing protein [Pusillimonas sp. MFBS29]